jgi:hypothetical protein
MHTQYESGVGAAARLVLPWWHGLSPEEQLAESAFDALPDHIKAEQRLIGALLWDATLHDKVRSSRRASPSRCTSSSTACPAAWP